MILNKIFNFSSSDQEQRDALTYYRIRVEAINSSASVIEFDLDGVIIAANSNFLNTVGYELDDIVGKSHRIFVDPGYANSPDYMAFWEKLRSGSFHEGQYKCFKKNGEMCWLQATYNPILDEDGNVCGVIKIAMDITESKNQHSYFESVLGAIHRSQAVIEFNLDGIIIHANNNFCNAMGYSLEEILGKHHRMFVETDYSLSTSYQEFWARLRQGHYHEGQFQRVKRDGMPIYLQAIYNPIFNLDGQLTKIVKFATDITEKKVEEARREHAIRTILSLLSESASSGIYSSTNKLVVSAERQNQQIQDILNSIEEMARTVAVNSKNTTKASEIASKNGKDALEGAEVVASTVAKIKQIASLVTNTAEVVDKLGMSSKQIGDIAQVIDDIADQTNLLALNAAIEAARAGSQGKGFAVVADEVRKLAERTSGATKEISEMIHSIQEEAQQAVSAMQQGKDEVEKGLLLADRAGDSLGEIVRGSVETVDMITQIAVASEEQSSTGEYVAETARSIAENTAESVNVVNVISNAAAGLKKLTSQIQDQVESLETHQGANIV